MAHHHQNSPLDTLYCSEDHWEEEHAQEEYYEFDLISSNTSSSTLINNSAESPHVLVESDMVWDEQELTSLLKKEQHNPVMAIALESERIEAVEWMLKVNAHYSFSPLTAILAVNYFDRFLFSFGFQNDKPWITHLAAVACLSLAAKVEETQVPFLIHLQQVEETRYLFEAKTIKRMEILVLSTLGWKMNPPTPLSFLDYITRRLGLKDHLSSHFLTNCQTLLLSLLPDSRFMCYLPSVLATATMMHVVKSVEPRLEAEYQRQLFGILRIDKEKGEKVNECCKVLLEEEELGKQCMKRKFGVNIGWIPGSPNGVIDVSFSCESSNDSWAVATAATSVSSSPEPLSKKSRSQDQIHLSNTSNSDFLDRL